MLTLTLIVGEKLEVQLTTVNTGDVPFVIGEAPIAGWNEGMLGMKPGGKRELRVPPALAYGEAGIDNLVPPNATLVFLIELLSAAQ